MKRRTPHEKKNPRHSRHLSCLVLALIHSDAAFKLLQLSLVMTVLIPVTAYVGMMFYKLNHRGDDFEDEKK